MDNEQLVLNGYFEDQHKKVAPAMEPGRFFNYFVADHLLRDRGLSWRELEDGVVDGGGDCGVDGVFTFVNEALVGRDPNLAAVGSDALVEVVLFQAKLTAGFSETAVSKLIDKLPRLLDVERDEEALSAEANEALLEQTRRFGDVVRRLAPRFPNVRVRVVFAARTGQAPHSTAVSAGRRLEAVLKQVHGDAKVEFVATRELLAAARQVRKTSRRLRFEAQLSGPEGVGYACLVPLRSYFDLITDEDGSLAIDLFESNVRDYEGRTPVNSAIAETLAAPDRGEDFWWLNNGVTIIARRAAITGREFQLESPQIVNGLQTTNEIYNHVKNAKQDRGDRCVLVRVLVPEDDETRDRVIRATNTQNELPSGALRATEGLQRNIEDYLVDRGWYYDRRKNFYKNQDRDAGRTVDMPLLAQVSMAFIVGRPDLARRHDNALLDDENYPRLFNHGMPLEAYAVALEVYDSVQQGLSSTALPAGQTADFLYHLMAMAGILLTRQDEYAATDIAKLQGVSERVTPARVQRMLEEAAATYQDFRSRGHKNRTWSDIARDEETWFALRQRTRRKAAHLWPAA